jgi:glycosyltransferase involved in cell wall biosynthesis
VYNEEPGTVRATVDELLKACSALEGVESRIIIVDDGSDHPLSAEDLGGSDRITLLTHEVNRGYGAALKKGIRAGSAEWIAILDADNTYPVSELPRLVEQINDHDMVVGVRTGSVNETPALRRPPKILLNKFASYLANTRIVDLNSGMRVFSRELAYSLWDLFPQRFSFTSTMTMGAIVGGFDIKEVPINYYKRTGSSTIHPIKDTINFFSISFRLGLLFSPMRIFLPMAGLLFLVGALKGLVRDYLLLGRVGNLAITLMLFGLQIFMMGLLGELIVHNRKLRPKAL